jgi:hypothetical protein
MMSTNGRAGSNFTDNQQKRDPQNAPVLLVPHLLAGVGCALSSGRPHRLSQRLHSPLHDQRVGYVRGGLPCHLHCQLGRFHDHQGRIPRLCWHRRLQSKCVWREVEHHFGPCVVTFTFPLCALMALVSLLHQVPSAKKN